MKEILCNKYKVLKKLAEGGMGCVYLVKDLHLNKLAAVKISKKREDAEWANADAEKEECILHTNDCMHREKEVLKQLSHPALPQIIDFFEEEGKTCLVMEYVEGITLEQYLRKFGRIEHEQAVKWAVELAEVLDYLHRQNPPVIYRDLKPANIMIMQSGRIKLIDFGAAAENVLGMQKEEFLAGTPGYSAPEQWQGTVSGKEGDIYSLGAVLHEMLTGIRPTKVFMERRPVREYDRSIPVRLEKIIGICTRIQPAKRYISMRQVRNALLSYQKKNRGRIVWYILQKGIGIFLCLSALIRTVQFQQQGIGSRELPVSFLIELLLLWGSVVAFRMLIRKGRETTGLKRQEKSILLTEKKFSGWYAGILIIGMLCSFPVLTIGLWVAMPEKENGAFIVSAGESRDLWVELLDAQNRKLLLKTDAVYTPEENLRLNIPCESLPKGQVSVQILAVDEMGDIYESRVFLVEGN